MTEAYYPRTLPNSAERIEAIRDRLNNDFLFREFLNDLASKSSWEVVCLYPELKLSAISVTHLRNIICPLTPRLVPEYRRFECSPNLRLVYSESQEVLDVAA